MPRYKPLKALKKLIRGQEQTSQQPNENTDNSAELKWELKNDYRLTDEELNGMSPAQLQQKQLDMQEKRKNALTRLKTKTSVPENAAQSMSYLKILEHLDRIASLESNTEAANTRYVIQENGQGIERTINNNPAPANHPPPGHRPAVQLGDTDRYQWIEISESTRLNETLLEDHANTNLIKDWSRSAPQRQWIPRLGLGEIELSVGSWFIFRMFMCLYV